MKQPDYYASERGDIVEIVPDGILRLLDVGCGMGVTSRIIKDRSKGQIEVTGIEIEPDIAEIAKTKIDRVIVGNVETTELPFGKGYFDCIIYGDVLEHLVDPWKLLIKHSELLREGGYAIISLPNVAHYRTIKMLLRKEWNYKDRGIFDNTHLRFFTIKSMKEMLANAGLEIIKINRKISASKSKKVLNKILFGALLDFMTEQYVIVARKRESR